MIAAVAILATAPFAGAFWDRDLGALARELAEHPAAPQAELFADLLLLCDCEPLPRLAAPDPLRQLLRIEAARRARLGARAAASDTVWRDVLRKNFFRRDPRNPPLDKALIWPDEEETWTGEIRFVDPPAWHCDLPARLPPAEDDSKLVDSLRAAGYPQAASRFAYHRASRLLARGEKSAAAEQARAVDPAALGELSHWAALLRIQLGADGADSAVALARSWSGPESLPVRALAVDHLARQARWTEVAEIAEAAGGADQALLEHVRLLRARALLELARPAEALVAIPRGSRSEFARDLALEALAGRTLDPAGLEALRLLWPDTADVLARLAERALFAGALAVARSAASALPREAPRARVVEAELAFAAGDRAQFAASLAWLSSQPSRASERLARGRAAVQLASALATLAQATPALRLDAAAALDALADRYGGSIARDLATAASALRTRQAASAGVVPIRAALPLPDLPKVQVAWPELRSLIAIPDGEGGLRDWFPAPAPLAGGPTP